MDTKTITTPVGKHKVIVKTSITGEDDREISKPVSNTLKWRMRMMELRTDREEKDRLMKEWDLADAFQEAENVAFQRIIISIDDSEKNIVKRVLNMDSRDYRFVKEEVMEIRGGENFSKAVSEQLENTEKEN